MTAASATGELGRDTAAGEAELDESEEVWVAAVTGASCSGSESVVAAAADDVCAHSARDDVEVCKAGSGADVARGSDPGTGWAGVAVSTRSADEIAGER